MSPVEWAHVLTPPVVTAAHDEAVNGAVVRGVTPGSGTEPKKRLRSMDLKRISQDTLKKKKQMRSSPLLCGRNDLLHSCRMCNFLASALAIMFYVAKHASSVVWPCPVVHRRVEAVLSRAWSLCICSCG